MILTGNGEKGKKKKMNSFCSNHDNKISFSNFKVQDASIQTTSENLNENSTQTGNLKESISETTALPKHIQKSFCVR